MASTVYKPNVYYGKPDRTNRIGTIGEKSTVQKGSEIIKEQEKKKVTITTGGSTPPPTVSVSFAEEPTNPIQSVTTKEIPQTKSPSQVFPSQVKNDSLPEILQKPKLDTPKDYETYLTSQPKVYTLPTLPSKTPSPTIQNIQPSMPIYYADKPKPQSSIGLPVSQKNIDSPRNEVIATIEKNIPLVKNIPFYQPVTKTISDVTYKIETKVEKDIETQNYGSLLVSGGASFAYGFTKAVVYDFPVGTVSTIIRFPSDPIGVIEESTVGAYKGIKQGFETSPFETVGSLTAMALAPKIYGKTLGVITGKERILPIKEELPYTKIEKGSILKPVSKQMSDTQFIKEFTKNTQLERLRENINKPEKFEKSIELKKPSNIQKLALEKFKGFKEETPEVLKNFDKQPITYETNLQNKINRLKSGADELYYEKGEFKIRRSPEEPKPQTIKLLEESLIKKQITYDIEPRYVKLYHGTSESVINKINIEGLKPKGQLKEVYLSESLEQVKGFATRTTSKENFKYKPIIIEANIPERIYKNLLVKREKGIGGINEVTLKEVPREYIKVIDNLSPINEKSYVPIKRGSFVEEALLNEQKIKSQIYKEIIEIKQGKLKTPEINQLALENFKKQNVKPIEFEREITFNEQRQIKRLKDDLDIVKYEKGEFKIQESKGQQLLVKQKSVYDILKQDTLESLEKIRKQRKQETITKNIDILKNENSKVTFNKLKLVDDALKSDSNLLFKELEKPKTKQRSSLQGELEEFKILENKQKSNKLVLESEFYGKGTYERTNILPIFKSNNQTSLQGFRNIDLLKDINNLNVISKPKEDIIQISKSDQSFKQPQGFKQDQSFSQTQLDIVTQLENQGQNQRLILKNTFEEENKDINKLGEFKKYFKDQEEMNKNSFFVYVKEPKSKTFNKISDKPLNQQDASNLLTYVIDRSTARSGFIKPTNLKPKPLELDIPYGYYDGTIDKFRPYKIRSGQKIRTKGIIEKTPYLIDSYGEVNELDAFKVLKQTKQNKFLDIMNL